MSFFNSLPSTLDESQSVFTPQYTESQENYRKQRKNDLLEEQGDKMDESFPEESMRLDDFASRSSNLNPGNSSQNLSLSMTLPHGFQLQRSLVHPKSTVRLVLYTPQNNFSDAFASLDTHYVHFWRGQARIQKTPIAGIDLTKEDLNSIQDEGNGLGGLIGISLWVYVRKHRLFIVATDHLELKVLDQSLVELSRSSSVKPVLSLEYLDTNDELIVGCIGSIRVWSLEREAENTNRTIFYLKGPRLVLNDLEDDEWANKTLYVPSLSRLYVACDNRIHIYDYASGKRLTSLPNLHDLSITCLALYKPTELLITGGKEGQIRVWNSQHHLVASLNAHSQAITSLLLPLSFSTMERPPPILLSSSLDGYLRLWDLDKLQCIYKYATQNEVLGMGMLKKDFFYHYSRKTIFVWHLNRLLSTYCPTQSQVILLKRVRHDQFARILVVSEDACTRLISPVSGEVIVTCFPTYKQSLVMDALHDLAQDRLYTLMSNGEIVIYSTSSNPAIIINVIEPILSLESSQITCFDAFFPPFEVLAGTATGQIIILDVDSGERQILVQAHPSDIVTIKCHRTSNIVFSAANDKSVKTWLYNRELHSLEPMLTFNCLHSPLLLKPTTSSNHEFLLASSNFSLTLYSSESTYQHASADDHDKQLTAINYLPSLRLFVTSGIDGLIKLWNNKNMMVREIQVGEPVTSVAFLNEKGDLIVGLHDDVSIIQFKDYLPLSYQKELQSIYFEEDILEEPLGFDSNIDFWRLFYGNDDFHKDQWALALKYSEQPVGESEAFTVQNTYFKDNITEPSTEILRKGAILESSVALKQVQARQQFFNDLKRTSIKRLPPEDLRRLSLALTQAELIGLEHLDTNDPNLYDTWPSHLDVSFSKALVQDEDMDYEIKKNSMPFMEEASSSSEFNDPSSEAARQAALESYRRKHRIIDLDAIAEALRTKIQENKSAFNKTVSLPNSTSIASSSEKEPPMISLPKRKPLKSKPAPITKKRAFASSEPSTRKELSASITPKEVKKIPSSMTPIAEASEKKYSSLSSSLLLADDDDEGFSFNEKLKALNDLKLNGNETSTKTTPEERTTPAAELEVAPVPSLNEKVEAKATNIVLKQQVIAKTTPSVEKKKSKKKKLEALTEKTDSLIPPDLPKPSKQIEASMNSVNPLTSSLPPPPPPLLLSSSLLDASFTTSPSISLNKPSVVIETVFAPIPVKSMVPTITSKLNTTSVQNTSKKNATSSFSSKPPLTPLPSLPPLLKKPPSMSATKPPSSRILTSTKPMKTPASSRLSHPNASHSTMSTQKNPSIASKPTLTLPKPTEVMFHSSVSTPPTHPSESKALLGLKPPTKVLNPTQIDLTDPNCLTLFSQSSNARMYLDLLPSSMTNPPYFTSLSTIPSEEGFLPPSSTPTLKPTLGLPSPIVKLQLKKIIQRPWFPTQLQSEPILNLNSILTCIQTMLHDTSDLSIKLECVSLMRSMYQSFHMDFQDPMESCVRPWLHAMETEPDWQLREYLVRQCPFFVLHGKWELMQSLITRLADVHFKVRQAALETFTQFQLRSKDELSWFMKQCHMIDPHVQFNPYPNQGEVDYPMRPRFRSRLDELYEGYLKRKETHQALVNEKVKRWKLEQRARGNGGVN